MNRILMNFRLLTIGKFRLLERSVRELLFWKWKLDSYFRSNTNSGLNQKATVILTCYSEKRARNMDPLIRTLLKCDFVEKVLLSNHNPKLDIKKWIKIKNDRFVLINQPVKRECGYRWLVAGNENADFFLIIDDDVLVKQKQVTLLFNKLIEHSEIPHGLSGILDNNYIVYCDTEVDILFNLYAVSKEHIKLYLKFVEKLSKDYSLPDLWIELSDDMIISKTGNKRPMIHDAGFLLHCKTFNDVDVALTKSPYINEHRIKVSNALEKIKQSETVI